MKAIGWPALAAFVMTIFAANWLVSTFGAVDWWGVAVPAGVFAAGVAFTLRDIAHRHLGAGYVVVAITIGAGVSIAVDPALAVASAAAFLVSEFADLSVYTPLRRRGWLGAVLASNAVGLVVDSMLFVWLAFGSLAFAPGQILGKSLMTGVAIAGLVVVQRRAVLA